jgi:hypothetical protein
MEEEILNSMDKKLDAIVRLLANQCITGKNKTESIITLDSLGLDRSLICKITDTRPEAVAARLSEAKKKEAQKGKKTDEAETK